MTLLSPDPKMSARMGATESVAIDDLDAVRALVRLCAGKQPRDLSMSMSMPEYRRLLKRGAVFFGLDRERVTTHSLRRGGATALDRMTGSWI